MIKNDFNDIKQIITKDGSIGLYNVELNEIYHDKNGAKKEAYEKFIEPVLKFKKDSLEILDICYGIGYNTKCALEHFKKINSIDCVEIDKRLVLKSFEFEYSKQINNIIKDNIKKPDFIKFYIQDIRNYILNCNKKYDLIFHDGFAPYKNPSVWSEELIKEIVKHLKQNGIYITYNHSKPVLNALYKTGIVIGKIIKNERTIATIASFNKGFIERPLDNKELSYLNTKSAITYHDFNLEDDDITILKRRNQEVKNSNLATLSSLIKEVQK